MRVVRLRPGLIFKREAASEIRRFFLGPLLPNMLVRPRLIPFVPDVPGSASRRSTPTTSAMPTDGRWCGDAEGAFNIAAEPTIGPPELASLLRARRVPVPAKALRAAPPR